MVGILLVMILVVIIVVVIIVVRKGIRAKAEGAEGLEREVREQENMDIIGALREGKFDAYENSVKSGSLDVNLKDTTSGNTALHYVVLSDIDSVDKVKWVKLLASLGADVDAKDNNGVTPMFNAIMNKDTEIMKCLAGVGADVNALNPADKDGSKTLIFLATQSGQTEVIKCLVSLGADVNTKNKDGYTPIFNATDKIACMRCLVELGADINARANSGITPVFMAVANNDIESLKYLKTLGADLNVKKNDGITTPLALGISLGDVPEAVNWLKANGAV